MRPLVATLLVLPREVRRADDKQHVQASAKGKRRDSRHPAKHRGSPTITCGGAIGDDRIATGPFIVAPRAGAGSASE
jgi:hypothetical protein